MKAIFFYPTVLVYLFALICFNSCTQKNPPTTTLTISAAISLKDALEEIKQSYQKNNPGVSIVYNFGGSGMLQQQIENGAPVDIFFSASPKYLDILESKQLLEPATRKNIFNNRLTIIVPKTNITISNINDLLSGSIHKIAVGEPKSVPAGKYAEEVFLSLHLTEAIKPKLIYTKDVRQALTYVETGDVDAGIVYLTDALISNDVRIVDTLDESLHSKILYPVAILRQSKHIPEAKELLQQIQSEEGAAIFQKLGFGIITDTIEQH